LVHKVGILLLAVWGNGEVVGDVASVGDMALVKVLPHSASAPAGDREEDDDMIWSSRSSLIGRKKERDRITTDDLPDIEILVSSVAE
jgi:hypothetical protein